MSKYQPADWPTVIPRIFADDVNGVVGFLKSVFGAHGQTRSGAPAEMRIGDSLVMVSDGSGMREERSAFLYVYMANTDEAYQRAIEAGAVTIEEPATMPYGDRRATVRDPWGNIWQIATHSDAPA